MKKQCRKRAQIFLSVAVASALAAMSATSYSADTTDLGTVGTSAAGDGQATAGRTVTESRAAAVAPTQSSLQVTQPQSVIGRSFIEDSKSPVSDFSAIAAIAPSVTLGISPNGPGLGETKNGIRGFKDGEFNVTFDGIPFGDTNGPTHHSTAYFPASVIGRVEVERGPGNASNFGAATFGGSVNLFSRDLAREQTISPFYSFGSWNTQLVGARYDSGTMPAMGDASFAINLQQLNSDGYRTFSAVQGQNLMFKLQKPIGDSSLITVNINYNKNWYQQNDKETGLTLAQADQLGKNYALSDDPNKANYYKYNLVNKSTAMNYVRLQSDLGSGWAIDDSAYYYNYTNNGLSSAATDLTTGLGKVTLSTGVVTAATQMPGYIKTNEYAVIGNIFKATRQLDTGLLRAGLWAEQADTHRALYDYNLLTGGANYDQAAVPGVIAGINNVKYEQNSGWKQYQPFAEFEWNATRDLKITPGLKYMLWKLSIDASVNQTARIEQHLKKDFNATLPFLTANYSINPVWSTYAQYAKGMLVPDISSFQSANADASDVKPQRSVNYQWGVVHKSDLLTFDTDLYYINFDNKIAQLPGSPAAQPVFYNQGGVVYKGIEGQVTYALKNGISLYSNGSINRAASKSSGLQIAGVPANTIALGVLYHDGSWSTSLVQKRVGTSYVLDDAAYAMNAYSTTDLNVSYTLPHPGLGAKSVKLQLGIFNLLNRQDIVAIAPINKTAGTALYGQPNVGDTFLWQPTRSAMVTVRADF